MGDLENEDISQWCPVVMPRNGVVKTSIEHLVEEGDHSMIGLDDLVEREPDIALQGKAAEALGNLR